MTTTRGTPTPPTSTPKVSAAEALRHYLTYLQDYGNTVRCCLRLSTEEQAFIAEREDAGEDVDAVDSEEEFDCESCQLRQKRDAMGPSASEALRVHNLLARRVVKDLALTPLVFDGLGLTFSTANRGEVLRFIELLDVVHEFASPLPDRPLPGEDG